METKTETKPEIATINWLSREFPDAAALRTHFVERAGFTGGWNVVLEGFDVRWPIGGEPVAVLVTAPDSWIPRHYPGVFTETVIAPGVIALTAPWIAVVRRALADALWNRLMVMVGGGSGTVRRSAVGCPVGQSYWYPPADTVVAGL